MWERWLQWLFPERCIGCGRAGALLCGGCLAGAPQYHGALPELGADTVCIVYAYEGVVREALLLLKYVGKRRIAALLGARVAARLGHRYAAVLAIPAARSRVAKRGYDQAVLLATAVAAAHGVPFVGGLVRRTDTVAQAHLDRAARERNVANAFVWYGPVPCGSVVLVDDICTTGATIRSAIEALRQAGFTTIDVAVVARGDKKTSRS